MSAKSSYLVLIVSILVLNSCLDIDLHTRIYPDGSCTRFISVEGDSSHILDTFFPIPLDSSWQPIFSELDDKHLYQAEKTFPHVEALNMEFAPGNPYEVMISIQGELQTSFYWFYSDLEYREIHRVNNPLRSIELDEYLSAEEVDKLFENIGRESIDPADSAELAILDERFNSWIYENEFQAFYSLVQQSLSATSNTLLSPEVLDAQRDTLYFHVLESEAEPGNVKDWADRFEVILGAGTITQLMEMNKLAFKVLDEKLMLRDEVVFSGYQNRLSLPGEIRESNADSLSGVTAFWNDYSLHLLIGDVEMTAATRHTNGWAWGITVLLLIGIGWYFFKNRRDSGSFPGNSP